MEMKNLSFIVKTSHFKEKTMKTFIKIISMLLVFALLAMTFVACDSTAIQGEQGEAGINGIDGKDGKDGKDGVDGKDGKDGVDGKDGKSAYELAVENGYSGTLNDWLFSLQGEDGDDGATGATGAAGATGADGVGVKDVTVKTVANGFVFTFTFTDGTAKSVLAATPAEKIETTTTTVNNGTEAVEVPATKEEINIASEDKADTSATLPEGVALNEGKDSVTLTVKELDASEEANTGSFAIDSGAEKIVLEIKIEEVHENNETPITVVIGAETVPAGLENVSMFHSGEAMTAVESLDELDAHNEFYYDKDNGGITLKTKNFSNFTIVSGGDVYVGVSSEQELADAIANQVSSIKLENNIVLKDNTFFTIANGADIRINLNNKTITAAINATEEHGTTVGLFTVANGAKLTINGNGNIALTTKVTNNTNISMAIFRNQGNIIINNGSYYLNDISEAVSGAWIVSTIVDTCLYFGNATTTINGGNFSIDGASINIFRNFPTGANAITTLTINGGKFTANPNKETSYIWNHQAGAKYVSYMNFNGGSYDSNIVYEDYYGQSDITVADGVQINPYSGNS